MTNDIKHGTDEFLGRDIPELTVHPDHMQVFMFSAVTWNRHHIHYSKDAAVDEGLPDVVVQRALIGNFFARLMTHWLGDHGELRKLAWKVTRSALPGRRITCRARIERHSESDDGNMLDCELTAFDQDGVLIASGRATVVIPLDRAKR